MPENTAHQHRIAGDANPHTNIPDLVLWANSTSHPDDVVGVGDVVADRFLVVSVILKGGTSEISKVSANSNNNHTHNVWFPKLGLLQRPGRARRSSLIHKNIGYQAPN